MDVQEIDGASYNGVDEVRKLQESLPYRPARDRFKIFIVDEVHMLSQNAWNAFLKTLEEPPPHVKFIFATTEVHKVPVTILSRVQRFDFKLIPTQLIAGRLRYVLEQEKIEADDAALGVVAREAAGSMRDAMSLLDQVIAWGGDKLTGDDVARVLGVASRKVLHELAGALVRGDAGSCAERDRRALQPGLRHRPRRARPAGAAARSGRRQGVQGARPPARSRRRRSARRERLAEATDADDLIRLHQGFSQGFDDVVRSGQPRAALEMLLVRLARRPPLFPIDELLRRLAALEQRLGAPRAAGVQRTAPRHSPRAPQPQPQPQSRRRPPICGRARRTHGRVKCAASRARDPTLRGRPQGTSTAQHGARTAPEPRATARNRSRFRDSLPGAAGANEKAEVDEPAPVGQLAAARKSNRKPRTLAAFRAILDRVNERRPELAAFLARASILVFDPGRAALGLGARRHVRPGRERQRLSRAARTSLASEHFGAPTKVIFEFDSARAATHQNGRHARRRNSA